MVRGVAAIHRARVVARGAQVVVEADEAFVPLSAKVVIKARITADT